MSGVLGQDIGVAAPEWIELRYYIAAVNGWYCVVERATGKVVSVMDRVP